jgi:metallo-beta-lactamase family protein
MEIEITRNERKYKLEDVIEDTINKGGVLMIPAFSLERTQDLLYEIRNLSKQNRIPEVPVYVDSPLAIDVTKIYKKYDSFFNKSVKSAIKEGGDIFRFQNIHFTYTRDESMQINKSKSPKIIIAGSGMSNGGRIQFHEKMYLNDPKNTLLIIGYQVPGSLGRQLVDGIKSVVIMGEEIKVKARIENIRGYSAHKDSENLLKFVEEMHDTLKHVYVVLGEPKSSSYLSQRIRDYLGVNATIPKFEEKVIIDL